VGHLQVVTGLSDQLYRNVLSVLGEFWGGGPLPQNSPRRLHAFLSSHNLKMAHI